MTPYTITLPFPPSLNAYYVNAKRSPRGAPAGKFYMGRMIGKEGVAYRAAVHHAVRVGHIVPPRFAGRLAMFVYAQAPERMVDGRLNSNRRDLDNLWKCLLDALTKAQVVLDDAQYDDIRMVRGPNSGKGSVLVRISAFDAQLAWHLGAEAGAKVSRDLLEAEAAK